MDFFIFFILVILSAVFSASETALFSLRESQVRLMERNAEWGAPLVAKLRRNPQRLLVTILIGNSVVNISIASFATVVAIGYFGSFGAGIATGFSTVIVLVLGGHTTARSCAGLEPQFTRRDTMVPTCASGKVLTQRTKRSTTSCGLLDIAITCLQTRA